MNDSTLEIIVQLIPMMLIQAILLFAVVPLARRSSRTPWLWIVFAIVPVLGALALPLLLGRGVAAMLERLDLLLSKTAMDK